MRRLQVSESAGSHQTRKLLFLKWDFAERHERGAQCWDCSGVLIGGRLRVALRMQWPVSRAGFGRCSQTASSRRRVGKVYARLEKRNERLGQCRRN
jgi:hypothetical protein